MFEIFNRDLGKKAENIATGICVFLIFCFAMGMIVLVVFREKGTDAIKDIIIFILLLLLVFIFSLIAKWQISEKETYADKYLKKINRKTKKEFLKKILNKENNFFNYFIRTLFHLMPLYFTLFVIKIDLAGFFKVILFVFSIFSYMLVELYYLYSRIIKIAERIKTENTIKLIIFVLCVPIALIFVTIYFTYTLSRFYMYRFPQW
jgi:hypothetical protein